MYSGMLSVIVKLFDFPCEQVRFPIRFCDFHIISVTVLIVSVKLLM